MRTREKYFKYETEIPDVVQSKLDAAFSSIKMEVAEMKAKRKQNKAGMIFKRIGIGAAAAVGTLAVGIGVIGVAAPTFAAKLPLIGGIFAQTESQLTFSGDYTDKAQVLTQETAAGVSEALTYTASDQGYSVTASEVYSDGYSVYLTMEITSEEQDFTYMQEVYTSSTDGATAALMYSPLNWEITDASGEVIESKNDLSGRLQGKVIDEHTFIGMLKLDMSSRFSSGNLKLDIYKLGFDDKRPEYQRTDTEGATNMAQGSWGFSMPVTVDPDVKTIEVNESAEGFTLRKVVISDFQIVAERSYPEGHIDFGGVAIQDHDGNKFQASDETVNTDDNTVIARFAVQGRDLNGLKVSVFDNSDDWFGAYKANDPVSWSNAVIVKEITLE